MPKGKPLDLTGQRFGRLIATRRLKRPDKAGNILWRCSCDCGKKVTVAGARLVIGNNRSCGCGRGPKPKPPSAPKWTDEQLMFRRVWYGMVQRCTNPKNRFYATYGGAGVRVEWESWEEMALDMGPRPTAKHSIDRKDTTGNYSRTNCRWATDVQQAANRRNTRRVVLEGQVMTLADAARATGTPYARARYLANAGRFLPEISRGPMDAVDPNPLPPRQ